MPPFLEFLRPAGADAPTPSPTPSPLRDAITAATRRPEPECVPPLVEEARLPEPMLQEAQALATRLVTSLRARRDGTSGGVEGLLQEFSLSSTEGIALMCLAEALLRIPDAATRDALIRDKISQGHWDEHVGHSTSAFVNAAAWGLMITGRLVATTSERSLSSALARLIGRGGEPVIRKGVDVAMRVMGEQFVTGETIGKALARSHRLERKGFRYSYDMLGEAATTEADAARFHALYVQAIHAIGHESAGRGIYSGPGISIKLSALHPRYSRAQRDRVMSELLPRVRELAQLARRFDVGLNIDAEESDRLELSLDILEALCFDESLAGWNGVGFVVQAYQKRCPFVIDHLVDLASRSRRRLMVRLVKGAYWDSEIKRAQIDGLEGYPVYTRKVYTDVAYLACARRLLAAPDQVYPQFATHNAATVAAVHCMAGPDEKPDRYEFQCLHGMGEPLYEEVISPREQGGLGVPCRIYAPVGTHETLLAYLVRRLLENGANTSFVNLIADKDVPVAALVADPVAMAQQIVPLGKPHDAIPLPVDMLRTRVNSAGIDLADEVRLTSLSRDLEESVSRTWRCSPTSSMAAWSEEHAIDVRNPADRRDLVGRVIEASSVELDASLTRASDAGEAWAETPVNERAACLERAAGALQMQMPSLLGLIVREAGKTVANAIGEVREAVDFLRYYAQKARADLQDEGVQALGVVACISPWNFPLSIFMGQVSAALVAGNAVVAKPAEQTPLIAAEAVRVLHEAGIPQDVLQLLPGKGESIGAALVADPRVQGVVFTGSTAVARSIASVLAQRVDLRGHPVVLIAETGGQNAMIVDSSALAEQVVTDALLSAFDSAGQRCSALRVLCLQEDIADRTLAMLKAAMRELSVGNPDKLSTDVGPVIDEEAHASIERHVAMLFAAGRRMQRQQARPGDHALGTFVAPTIIELESLEELRQEIFGPVLHVVRYRRERLDELIEALNDTGYGLTFGLHTRIDETIAQVVQGIHAGNVYVNRNIIGAVVGVQPFGGEGLSGTGPKAGGPLYLHRLVFGHGSHAGSDGRQDAVGGGGARVPDIASALHAPVDLPGPTGESNTWRVTPRGRVLCVASTHEGARLQWDAVEATGNKAVWLDTPAAHAFTATITLPHAAGNATNHAFVRPEFAAVAAIDAVLFEGTEPELIALNQQIAAREGPLIPIQSRTPSDTSATPPIPYSLVPLIHERSVSINTAAAGGNAALMTIG